MKTKRVISVLMCVLLTVSITGCGKTGGSSGSSSNAEDPGGTQKVLEAAVTVVNNTYDPWAAPNAYDDIGRMQIYDTLVFKDGDGNLSPSLAESWTWSDDALSVTFTLRQGVLFHNGDEMKASDVKFSLDTVRTSDSYSTYFANVDRIETEGDYTVTVYLNSPNVALLEVLMTFGQIVNEKVYTAAGEQVGTTLGSVVGTGPYKLKEWNPGEYAIYQANEAYFKGEPNVKEVRVSTIADANSATISLQTGSVDAYLQTLPAISVGSLKQDSKLTVDDITSKRLYYLGMNNERGPFAGNTLLREAVACGVDRDALNSIANEGLGEIVYYPGGPDYSGQPGVKDSGYHYDPERAKELVKQAGAEGLSFTISLENSGCLSELATALQSQFREIGLNASVDILEVNAYLKDVYSEGNYDMFISFTTAKTKDMDTVWTNLFHTENIGQGNSSRYSNKDMDRIIESARSETDVEARKALYADGVKIFDQDIPMLPLFYEYANRAHSSQLAVQPGMAEYDNLFYYSWK